MKVVWLARLAMTLEMIKFEHSIFALPFALTAALLAWREAGFQTANLATKVAWIVLAMVGARSAAMAFNRLLDAEIDARNPRTRMRHLPAGLLSRQFVWGFALASALLFFTAALMLNPLCFQLAPIALAVLLFYSYTKRFTSASHLVLGFALGMAPSAAWIAMQGSLDPRIVWLTAAVTLWTAGFDIIYACQDFEFDRREGLFSIPKSVGLAKALWIARLFHLGMVACLAALAMAFKLGTLAWVGILIVAGLLVYEHRLVKPSDLSRVNAAFFTVNGWVSMLFFAVWATEIVLHRQG
ncbi:MAG: putative 4-hydroxybenzoate polyprenyltransferase [Bryobacteraceae bacterium]|nr:putative 4-hydroxybenzoate polyprenyltransferase [Bryobacteraceae bacterium]MDW8378290.1 UbiA-like polyprenyltransferase [Bryobacterales bacterium]